ncbi:MAG: tryptophan 7-halogenase [Alteromonadaceae bacterium]|nr:tryptophan 7-halogenase [Alteromonadaceae bacterium]
MENPINNIVIVGGGTAGWMVASRLAAQYLSHTQSKITITLVESASVKPVGVGEGTWPTMRTTLKKIGISEAEFIRECDATFKQGSKFNGWVTGNKSDYYYHPFVLPQDFSNTNLMHHWQEIGQASSFSNAVCVQEQLCAHGLAPKQINTPEYASVANYGYHLNAGKFAALLQKHCLAKFSVKHIIDDVIKVNSAKNGDIASISTQKHGEIKGDLFIDCTGFACLLLGKHLKVPFIDKSDTLFIDTALTVQVPYENDHSPISCVTQSTATSAGWIWDIGLTHRRGIGHVFSSRHTSETDAEAKLKDYIGQHIKSGEIKKIKFKPGHRSHCWEKNCIAVGLSAGFLEPLEASSLVQIEFAADWLCDQLPATRTTMDIIAKRFNQAFTYRWSRLIDFLKLHYVLSKRTDSDSDFWIENRHSNSIPESLKELLSLWQHHYPWHHDFEHSNEIFSSASYQYILAGMGFRTNANYLSSDAENALAMKHFTQNQTTTNKYLLHLPKHRELLNQIIQYGFQPK